MQPSELRVLVCDDSIMVQKKMSDLLKNNGYTCIYQARDGQTAVDTYKEVRPHVVFMDIVMPVKTGVEALTEIAAFDPQAKVYMASSVGTQSNVQEAILRGAADFLQKPVDDALILKIMASISKQV